MSSTVWVTSYLVPAIATVICNIMWFAPLEEVLEARKSKSMGHIDPVPFGKSYITYFL
jgi:hypothetical protein